MLDCSKYFLTTGDNDNKAMDKIEWLDKYRIGIPEIDLQHQALISIINQFIECNDDTDLLVLLDNLSGEMLSHNLYEEQLLDQHNYPDLERHKREHADEASAFSSRIKDIINNHSDSRVLITEQLKRWFEHHLLIDDMAYRQYLVKKGVL